MKLDILAIGVHPDDVELGCGATILKQIALGYKVGILDLTQGELGTRGNAKLRLEEAENARAYAGALVRENIGLADGFFSNDRDSKIKIIQIIRKYQPEIILANAVKDRHPDHGNAAKLIYEACFLSGLLKIETQWDNKVQEKWRPRKLFNYIQDFDLVPHVVVDVSDYIEQKIEMVLHFRSQFYTSDKNEPETPISSKDFIDNLRGRARAHGRRIGVKYGEGFTCENFIGTDDIMKIL